MVKKREYSLIPNIQTRKTRPPWQIKVEHYILRGMKQTALNYLEGIIRSSFPLFPEDEEVIRNRRLAWRLRINLLQEWNRPAEALAWICLECELNPNNVEAAALKERLLRDLNLHKEELDTKESPPDPGNCQFNWVGVAGMRLLKAEIEQDVLLPVLEKAIYERFKVGLPNGILFYGPPGCGKTFFARKIAEQLDFYWKEIKPSDLGSIYVHGSQLMIGELFKEAEDNSPSLLFFDEIDAFLPSRQELSHHYSNEVNEFLSHLNEASKRGILVIGATNYIEKIDSAVLRPGRFDKKIFIGLPDLEARQEIFVEKLKNRPIPPLDYYTLAKISDGVTPADIDLITANAARRAIREKASLITINHLIKEIEIFQPSSEKY